MKRDKQRGDQQERKKEVEKRLMNESAVYHG